jgi:hypothetical protein
MFDYDPEFGTFTHKAKPNQVSGTWAGRFYTRINTHKVPVNGCWYPAGPLIWKYMTGEDRYDVIHLDGDGSNLAWSNLALASGDTTTKRAASGTWVNRDAFNYLMTASRHILPRRNSSRKPGESGALGVTFDKTRGAWRAKISILDMRRSTWTNGGKRHLHLGLFKHLEDAVEARKLAERLCNRIAQGAVTVPAVGERERLYKDVEAWLAKMDAPVTPVQPVSAPTTHNAAVQPDPDALAFGAS